jgi:hypothetical protein
VASVREIKSLMPYLVRLNDSAALEDLLAALNAAGVEVQRRGRQALEVVDSYEDLEAELFFFLRSWALSQPRVVFVLERVVSRCVEKPQHSLGLSSLVLNLPWPQNMGGENLWRGRYRCTDQRLGGTRPFSGACGQRC